MTTSGLCAHMFSGHSTIIILTGSPVPQLLGPWVCCWGLHPGIARGPTSHRKNRKTHRMATTKTRGLDSYSFLGWILLDSFDPPKMTQPGRNWQCLGRSQMLRSSCEMECNFTWSKTRVNLFLGTQIIEPGGRKGS